MELRPGALRFVLAQGLTAQARVGSDSMTPALARGAVVSVETLAGGEPRVGDIVLIFTGDDADPLLHRVMHVFSEGGQRWVMHQGDAPTSTFATCPLDAVMARAVGFAAGSDPGRTLPTLDRLGAEDSARFWRRRRACQAFAWGWRLGAPLGLRRRPLGRRLARLYRSLARAVAG
jgi:hypothetical protein